MEEENKKQELKETDILEGRDLRNKEKYYLDDKFLNGYAKLVGPNGGAIYNSLCRHINKEQKCWPSIKKLKEEWSMSAPRVIAALKILEFYHIIKIKRIGRGANNRYWLLDKKHWLKITEDNKETLIQELKKLELLGKETLILNLRNFNSYSKVTHSKVTQKKGINSDYPIIASKGLDNSNRKKKKNTDLEETQSTSKHSAALKRKDFRVKPEVYKELTDAYEKYKGIKLQGAEYGEVKRAIKTMLYSGRTKKNIIDFMKFCSEIGEDDKDLEWLKNWTILTIKRKMPEFLAGKIKKKVDNAEEEEEEYKIVKFYGKSATKN